MMKKYLTCCLLVVLITSARAQVCTGDFVFETQSDVDQFLIDNPSCTSIYGNITITTASDLGLVDPITNLNGLQNIITIDGDLEITVTDTTLSFVGLSALIQVDGRFTINGLNSPSTFLNFVGLENLNTVIELALNLNSPADFSVFDQLYQVDKIEIYMSSYIEDVVVFDNAFPAVNYMSDGFYFHTSGITETEFSAFNGLNSAVRIEFSYTAEPMFFTSFDAFRNLQGCVDLVLDNCSVYDFIDGFENLEMANGIHMDLYTYDSEYPSFENLFYTDLLMVLGGSEYGVDVHFPALQMVQNELWISGSFISVTLDSLQSVGSLYIDSFNDNPNISFTAFSFPMLESINSDLSIQFLDIADLSIFPSLINVEGDININDCANLSDCAIAVMCERVSVDPASVILDNNAPGCNTVDEVLSACSISYITGLVYADMNCDGELNGNDIPLPNSIIHDQNNLPIGSSFANGEYYSTLTDNSNTFIHAMVPSGFFSGPEYAFTTTDMDEIFSDYDFPLCPDLNFHDVRVYAHCGQPRPGFYHTYQVFVANEAVPIENVLVTFDITNMLGSSIFTTNGTVTGNTVSWTVTDLTFLESNQIFVQIYVDPTTPLGTIYSPIMTATLLSAITDDDPSDNNFTLNQIVVGSYDPNDKSVNTPALNLDEINAEEGAWLDYTIRFQNTGTAEAINVRVDDIIEEDLDLSTFQMLDASHSFQLSFEENRKVEWLFENILLPDSFSNEPASHGFIHFRIKTKDNLQLTDVIENSVAIYFDFNEPIITNTANTIFYICPEQITVTGTTSICEGETAMLYASQGWTNYQWILNNEVAGDEIALSVEGLTEGLYSVHYVGSTQYCESMDMLELNVNGIPATPAITQSGNTLTATGSGTFTWTLNGETLSESDSSIEMIETGNYEVSYVDVCPSLSASGVFDFVSVNEWSRIATILIAPNPSTDFVNLSLPEHWIGRNELKVTDATGRLVVSEVITSSKTFLDASALQSGCYQISILNAQSGEAGLVKWMIE
jgi:uncharacterized repeat protein (TIGR01451 family)